MSAKQLSCLSLCLCLTLGSLAVDANPFQKPVWAQQGPARVERQQQAVSQLQLKAILWSTERPLANINGQILEIGDSIAGFTVSQITESQVQLETGGRLMTLSLDAQEITNNEP